MLQGWRESPRKKRLAVIASPTPRPAHQDSFHRTNSGEHPQILADAFVAISHFGVYPPDSGRIRIGCNCGQRLETVCVFRPDPVGQHLWLVEPPRSAGESQSAPPRKRCCSQERGLCRQERAAECAAATGRIGACAGRTSRRDVPAKLDDRSQPENRPPSAGKLQKPIFARQPSGCD